jgi:hypothetical protein
MARHSLQDKAQDGIKDGIKDEVKDQDQGEGDNVQGRREAHPVTALGSVKAHVA